MPRLRFILGLAPALALGFAITAQLEAANFVVTHTVDLPDSLPGDGFCAGPFGACTLRAAVMEANAGSGMDTILLAAGTYRLTRTSGADDGAFGDLDISQPVEIVGAGMRDTVISASTGDRVVEIHGATAALRALTLRDGRAAGGGGVRVDGGAALQCQRCLIRDNRSTADGGGIEVLADGTADFLDSNVGSNLAAGCGGGLAIRGTSGFQSGRITRNRALGGGGGFCVTGASATLAVSLSAVDGNVAGASGGGGDFQDGLSVLLNSTLSGNLASRGGGLHVGSNAGVSGARQVTIADNRAAIEAGGVWVEGGLGLANSLLADNQAPTRNDCLGLVTSPEGHNLVEDINGCSFAGNLNGYVTGQDPGLLPLGNYGGPTPTHELASEASPARNAGADDLERGDQRGYSRPIGSHPDIGATEFLGIVPVGAALVDFPFSQGAFELRPTQGNLRSTGVLLDGTLTAFGGRPGLDYILADGAADYGTLDPGTARSCMVAADCYLLAAAVPDGEERPLGHIDAVAEESAGPAREIWRLHVSGSFLDLAGEPAGRAIEQLVHAHATNGCATDRYCPSDALTRRQLALLVEQAASGEFPLPFLATGGVFADVPAGDPFAEWIERFAADGAGGGCTGDPDGGGPLLPRFCPEAPARRDQLARAVVRLRFGAAFVPPACESRPFADVLPGDPSCPWILAAAQQGVPGCTDDPDGSGSLLALFCPETTATRSQAAAALARGFGLANWSLGL